MEKAKMKKIAIAAVLLTSMTAFAQTATPGFDQRQANQERRIDQGVASGQLTQREAARLDRGQEHLQRMEDKAKSDGAVTRQERSRLQHAADVQSRHIYREKHDRQRDLNHDGRMDRPARR
jgi:uncharacterized membrane protein YebE (DUF533 family)